MKKKDINLVKTGKKIRALRIKLGHTQETLAESANILGTYVGRIERGELNIRITMLLKIAFALKVEPHKIIPRIKELKDPRKN